MTMQHSTPHFACNTDKPTGPVRGVAPLGGLQPPWLAYQCGCKQLGTKKQVSIFLRTRLLPLLARTSSGLASAGCHPKVRPARDKARRGGERWPPLLSAGKRIHLDFRLGLIGWQTFKVLCLEMQKASSLDQPSWSCHHTRRRKHPTAEEITSFKECSLAKKGKHQPGC